MTTCDTKNGPLYAWASAYADGPDIIKNGRMQFPLLVCFARCKPNLTHIPKDHIVTAGGCMNSIGEYAKDGVSRQPKIITAACSTMSCTCLMWDKACRPSKNGKGSLTLAKQAVQDIFHPLFGGSIFSEYRQPPNASMVKVKPDMIYLGRASSLPMSNGSVMVIDVDFFVAPLNDKASTRRIMSNYWDVPSPVALRIELGRRVYTAEADLMNTGNREADFILARRDSRMNESISPVRSGTCILDKKGSQVVGILCGSSWEYMSVLPFSNRVASKLRRGAGIDCDAFYTALQSCYQTVRKKF